VNLGPLEIGLILLAVLLLFGYKKLPDASRSLGRSLRIFKGEMKGMKDDAHPATPSVVAGEVVDSRVPEWEAEARAAEVRAAEARVRADAARASVSDTAR
jgi:sec-independent protein translocase protein TatA